MDKYKPDNTVTWVHTPLSKSTNNAIKNKAKSKGKTLRRYLQGLIHKDLRED